LLKSGIDCRFSFVTDLITYESKIVTMYVNINKLNAYGPF